MERRKAIVFDIDGVLADSSYRYYLVEEKGWKDFFSECHKDPPLPLCVIAREMWTSMGHRIILLTGRPESIRDMTAEWLRKHEVYYDLMLMRQNDHYVGSEKRETLEELMKVYDIVCAFEDDPKNVLVYRSLGIPVVAIHSGYYSWEQYTEYPLPPTFYADKDDPRK